MRVMPVITLIFWQEVKMRRSRFLVCFSLLLVILVGTAVTGCGKNTGNPVRNTPVTSSVTSNATSIATSAAVQSLQEPLEKGDPDWWKKQPDLNKEDQAIQTVMTDFEKALAAKDLKQVAAFFSPDVKDKYSAALAKSPDLMPQMAKELEKAKLSFLSLDTDFELSRMAEYALTKDGNTFYITFIKIDGKWLLESF
jgi:hypothetical protein